MARPFKKLETKFKRLWLRRLRSKRYKQCTGRLRTAREKHDDPLTTVPGDAFCCLGVAADCINSKGWSVTIDDVVQWREKPGDRYRYNDFSAGQLRKLGLSATAQEELIRMNDDTNATFEQIADWIEEHL